MLIKTVFDIQTKQIGYAVCNAEHRCGFVTYSITNAIKAAQCKDFNQVQQLING
jgi:RNase H-fold protein (predicted Holliday junction resolvase)